MRIRILGLLLLATSPLCAEVEIRVAGDRVSLHAVSAPVSEILDSLARHTGMRLIYDAPRPRQALSATLENRTPAEAVLSVLEGLGLNYALVMDRSGARVEQLLILGTLVATAGPGRPTPPSRVQQRMPAQEPDPVELDLMAEEEDPDAESALDPMDAPPAPSPTPSPASPKNQ